MMITINALQNHDYDTALNGFRSLRADQARINPTEQIFRAACPNLASLACALNGLESAGGRDLRDHGIDLEGLPVYGDNGDWVQGAYSWDERYALVPENPRTGAREWNVIPRWDLPGDGHE